MLEGMDKDGDDLINKNEFVNYFDRIRKLPVETSVETMEEYMATATSCRQIKEAEAQRGADAHRESNGFLRGLENLRKGLLAKIKSACH